MNRFAEAIEQARVDVVPKILIGGTPASGGGNGSDALGGGNLLQALLALLLSDKLAADVNPASASSPGAQAYRRDIETRLGTHKA